MNQILVTLPNDKQFDILRPDPELIDIETMARNLARINRFTGNVGYSVGQHSINTYRYIQYYYPSNYELQLAELLHDGSEYITNDIISPIKDHLMIKVASGKCIEFKKIEDRITRAIEKKLECKILLPFSILKQADWDVGSFECENLLPDRTYKLDGKVYQQKWKIPDRCDVSVWSPEKTEKIFLNTYYKLKRLIDETNLQKNICQDSREACRCATD